MTDRKLTPATRDDVIQAIQHGMLFDGRKRTHNWDSINAQVAARRCRSSCWRRNRFSQCASAGSGMMN